MLGTCNNILLPSRDIEDGLLDNLSDERELPSPFALVEDIQGCLTTTQFPAGY
jgi:hypothetical protein